MQYAERLPSLPARGALAVPLAALAIGAAAATGAYALIDDDSVVQQAGKVVVVEQPDLRRSQANDIPTSSLSGHPDPGSVRTSDSDVPPPQTGWRFGNGNPPPGP